MPFFYCRTHTKVSRARNLEVVTHCLLNVYEEKFLGWVARGDT